MRKFLAIFAAAAMVLSLAACNNETEPNDNDDKPMGGNSDDSSDNNTPDDSSGEEQAPPVEAEPIPDNPLIYLGFEDTTGLTAVKQVANDGSVPAGITYALKESDHDILIAEGQGAVGNALYLDGKYGVDFDMVQINDDSYTISFWFNADRVATFGPVVQMGRNLAGAADPVTWINVTKTEWGASNAAIFPVLWNRNSSIGTEVAADGVWPWMYAMDDMEHGKREWCLITVVVDGNRYVCVDDGMERIGTHFYLNGELMHEATAENMFYQGLAPEIFAGDGLEGHIGINYWDTIYKGFIDEFYVFDEALTAGQVKTLYEMGNPPAEPVAPEYEYEGDGDEGDAAEPEPLPEAPVDSSAIDVLGTPDRVQGFWSDSTDGFELADGGSLTIKLNNYSDGRNNWDNFVLAFTNTAVTTDKLASADNYAGYAEYAVLRADAFGWGDGLIDPVYETSWGDDWAGWLSLMTEAKVEVAIARDGNVIAVAYVFTGADGTVMTETAAFSSTMAAGDPVYVHLAGEGSYIELLSVE